jgi:hypothetical protein
MKFFQLTISILSFVLMSILNGQGYAVKLSCNSNMPYFVHNWFNDTSKLNVKLTNTTGQQFQGYTRWDFIDMVMGFQRMF